MASNKKITKQQELQAKQQMMQLAQANRFPEAKSIAMQLLELLPNDLDLWNALGQLQVQTGELVAAIDSFEKVCAKPSKNRASALSWLVQLCLQLKQELRALPYARMLVKVDPKSAQNNASLGRILSGQHLYLEAQEYLEKAQKLSPKKLGFKSLAAVNRINLGQCERAVAELEEVVAKSGGEDSFAEGNRPEVFAIWALNYIDNISEQRVYEKHREYVDRYVSSKSAVSKIAIPKDGPIKLGICSSDLYRHSVAYFLEPILKAINSEKWHIYFYSDSPKFDEVSERLKSQASHWRNTAAMGDAELAELIATDGIHILFDLVGFIGKVRLGCFALKPAPIQVTYLGYPNTTGLDQMDYRLTDRWCDPVGQTDQYHSESLVHLPKGFLTFQPDEDAPEVTALPAADNGYVTFGSFNIFQKISDRNIDLWVKLLLAIPDARLLLKSRPLSEVTLQKQVRKRFTAAGIDAKRLKIMGWTKEASSHLDLVGSVDIHLDTFPYNGTTTTCQALWQGVPTLSLAGEVHRTRVGLSLMSQVGLSDWVAFSEESFVSTAIEKAQDLKTLAEIRSSLRDRMDKSALRNPALFIQQFESALDTMIEQSARA